MWYIYFNNTATPTAQKDIYFNDTATPTAQKAN